MKGDDDYMQSQHSLGLATGCVRSRRFCRERRAGRILSEALKNPPSKARRAR